MNALTIITVALAVALISIVTSRVLYARRQYLEFISLPPERLSLTLAMALVAGDHVRVKRLSRLLELGGYTVPIDYAAGLVSVQEAKK